MIKRTILLGLWLSALLWPYAHAGQYPHAFWLSLLPLAFSLGELWPQWYIRVAHWLVAAYLALSLAWNTGSALHWLGIVVQGAIHQVFDLPFNQWAAVNDHVTAPLLVVGAFLGWLLFRQCKTYTQALVLLILGATVIPFNHVLWNLPAEVPLAMYLVIGLLVLIFLHQERLGRGAFSLPRSPWYYGLAAVVAILPVVIGFQMPEHNPSDPLNVMRGKALAGLAKLGADTTGYGPGVTQIGQSLVPNHSAVFIAHTATPHYWQAAVYNTFNGTTWSNQGPQSTAVTNPHKRSWVFAPYFLSKHTQTFHVTLTDLSAKPFTTLFYAGVPIQLSLPATAHSRSLRLIGPPTRQYHFTAVQPVYNMTTLMTTPLTPPPASLRVDLELPSNLSPRVSKLARTVAGSAYGPWQAAQDLKDYLDQHYHYSYHVTPAHNDVVNHFLFVDKQGYCDQFSTAFIMMMRSLGVPARWVVGYDSGTYNNSQHGWLVRAVDAHAWAEFWIQGVGWIPIDPTPGFHLPAESLSSPAQIAITTGPSAVVSRSHPSVAVPTPKPHLPLKDRVHLAHHAPSKKAPAPFMGLPHWLKPLVSLLGALALLFLLGMAARRLMAQRQRPTHLWHRIQRLSRRRLGTRWTAKSPRQWGLDWLRYFPEDDQIIWPFVALLERAFYSGETLSAEQTAELKRLWQQLTMRKGRSA